MCVLYTHAVLKQRVLHQVQNYSSTQIANVIYAFAIADNNSAHALGKILNHRIHIYMLIPV